jgi:hypothetical protein
MMFPRIPLKGAVGAFLDEPAAISQTTMDVNLRGPVNGVRLARRLMYADRALRSVDSVARAEYDNRVAKQVKR